MADTRAASSAIASGQIGASGSSRRRLIHDRTAHPVTIPMTAVRIHT
jgi:hypothetical protein